MTVTNNFEILVTGSLVSCSILTYTLISPQKAIALPTESQKTTTVKNPAKSIKTDNHQISPPSQPETALDNPEFSQPPSQSPSQPSSIPFSEDDPLKEINSVDQLSDVQPSDWAYQALKSLIDKYGVKISGFTDNTFKGDRPINRYQFTVGLAAVLDKIEDKIGNAIGEQYVKDDIIILKRLKREFQEALAQLTTSIDTLEARNAELQANQFSPTTKLQGEQILAYSDGNRANKTIISRTRLNLATSFNQQDLLFTQLESGNNGGDAIGFAQQKDINLLGVNGLLANGGGLDFAEVESGLNLRRLYYSFRPTKDLAVTVGSKISPRDFIDHNRYANKEGEDFSSSFFLNNPLVVQNQIDRQGGAGVVVAWDPKNSPLKVRSLYIANNANETNGNAGLFGDTHQGTVELEYSPRKELALRLQYTNAEINNTDINALGLNGEYSFNRNMGVFGRLGFGNYQGFNTKLNQNLDLQPWTWALGLGLKNLLLPGTLAGFAVGQPFIAEGAGNSTQTNFEAFYNLELSDNLSVTPVFSLVTNADNESRNGTIWQGTLRTVISF
jgi:Carbohydrate-selective porin, OprB family/S-layer homology domain